MICQKNRKVPEQLKRNFTLIELLVVIAQYCRNHVKVLYNRCGLLSSAGGALVRICTDKYGKVRRKAPQKPAFGGHHNACKASASCTDSALHICRRQMLHTFVCLTRRCVQDTKCFIRSAFTLIELLVTTAQQNCIYEIASLERFSSLSRDFFIVFFRKSAFFSSFF